nr:MAG TPA: hypothetical protein [Caudoviricetes sp.]
MIYMTMLISFVHKLINKRTFQLNVTGRAATTHNNPLRCRCN